jgi:hypothetical protein
LVQPQTPRRLGLHNAGKQACCAFRSRTEPHTRFDLGLSSCTLHIHTHRSCDATSLFIYAVHLCCSRVHSAMFHLRLQPERRRLPKPRRQNQPDALSNVFQHEPLDLTAPSIRLIRILPARNSDDFIRCSLRLASTDTEYTCLSYVWGHEDSGEWIDLNNKRFPARQNLCSFLRSARHLPVLISRWLWIDAICIDQFNTPELQHQVQQMGRIYAGAEEVISWLGTDQNIVTSFRDCSDNGRLRGLDALYRSPYWSRAWVVQEVILGARVMLMAGVTMLRLDALLAHHTARRNNWAHDGVIHIGVLHMRKLLQSREPSSVTLMYLLHYFQHQLCHTTRDRVFSLLGLCRGGIDLRVDYNISDHNLAVEVLKHAGDAFCLCSIYTISRALKLHMSVCTDGYSQDPSLVAHTSLDLRISQRDSQYLQPRYSQPQYFLVPSYLKQKPNSDCIRHRERYCPEYDTHSITCTIASEYEPGEPSLWITMNLNHLCSMHCGQLIIEVQLEKIFVIHRYLRSSLDETRFARFAVEDVFHKECKWEYRSRISVQLLEHGRACRIILPLDFWFLVAKMSKSFWSLNRLDILQDTCCSRVTSPESQRRENGARPCIKLLADGQPVGKYFNLPQDVDEFIDCAW